MTENDRLRETFNSAALEYDAIRPGYPSELIEDVIQLSGIPDHGQALEIGCGTGQATMPFAQRGYRITCLDIGADLIALAREKLSQYPDVVFQNISFEAWSAKAATFHLVFSATAFHWIPREVGYSKAALALMPGGALAVFSNSHPRPYSGFFREVQPIYQRMVPEWNDPAQRPSTDEELKTTEAYIRSTGLFSSVVVKTYPWVQAYTSAGYIRLLNTYSNHLLLEDGRRQELYQSIADLIERRYGGVIERPYLALLYLGKK
jgi:trans-aconitate methyltransferase